MRLPTQCRPRYFDMFGRGRCIEYMRQALGLRQQLIEPDILRLKCLETFDFDRLHPAVPVAPVVKGKFR